MLKKIFTGFLAASVLVSASAYAMTGAVYQVTPGIEVLKSVSTADDENWDTHDGVRLSVTDGSLRVRGSGDLRGVDMLAGGDLYGETASTKAMFWDFESNSDVFDQANDAALLAKPEDVPEGKMANFFSTSSYWVRPTTSAFGDQYYKNDTLGTIYNGEKTDPAPGSTKAGSAGLGKNDWNYATLGMKVKLSAEKFAPGETYVLSFYCLNNTGEREMYAETTRPSQPEPKGTGEINWLSASAKSIGKVRQYWTELKTEITPSADDYENGYTMLWIGETAGPCQRSERLYLDNVCLVRKSDLTEQELVFSAKVKGDASVSIAGDLQGEKLFGTSAAASEDWRDVELKFTVDRTGTFYIGEKRGSASSASRNDFKVSFTSAENFYIKDVSIQKQVDAERFENVNGIAGYKISASAKAYVTDSGTATAVLALSSADGEQVIEQKECTLTAGVNTIALSGAVSKTPLADSIVSVYLKDADGNIISERKQSVAQLYPNGVNIVGASKKVFGGLEIFGKGTYLVEFTTDDTSAKTATVTIGSVTETAAIENGIGVCEIELTDSAIGSMSADTTISISGTAEKITLKKVMD